MKVIAVDTGNRLIKTPHYVFNSGIVRHGKRPPAIKTDMLCFDGEYYTITQKRNPYLKDKTTDDTYFLLTLFAIGKELSHNGGQPAADREQIFLAVGLPPSHLPIYKDSFAQYFISKGRNVNFEYNGKLFSIEISRVTVYPQGFCAVAELLGRIKDYPRSYIVDIGGYTTDVVLLANGKPDMSFCHSFNFGVIHMDNEVKRVISAQYDVELEDAHIESSLMGNTTLPEEIRRAIEHEAGVYADELVRNLKEKGVDPTINMLLFVGGGSELFRNVLSKSCPISIFQTNVCANAIGYAKMTSAAYGIPYVE